MIVLITKDKTLEPPKALRKKDDVVVVTVNTDEALDEILSLLKVSDKTHVKTKMSKVVGIFRTMLGGM